MQSNVLVSNYQKDYVITYLLVTRVEVKLGETNRAKDI